MAALYLLFLHVLSLVILYTEPVSASRPRILLYSATTGFRHDSIPTAIAALKAKEDEIDVEFFATEDPAQFTDDNLAGFDAVLFLSTTGDGAWSYIRPYIDNLDTLGDSFERGR